MKQGQASECPGGAAFCAVLPNNPGSASSGFNALRAAIPRSLHLNDGASILAWLPGGTRSNPRENLQRAVSAATPHLRGDRWAGSCRALRAILKGGLKPLAAILRGGMTPRPVLLAALPAESPVNRPDNGGVYAIDIAC